MSDKKPREWWINPKTGYITEKAPEQDTKWQKRSGVIFDRTHVIEHSAYDSLQKELTETRLTYYEVVEQRNAFQKENEELKARIEHLAKHPYAYVKIDEFASFKTMAKLTEVNASLRESLKLAVEALGESCYCDAGWYRSTEPCGNCEALAKIKAKVEL